MSAPSSASANPPLNSAKVLVQMFLMIRQTPVSDIASAIITAPAAMNETAGRAVVPRR